VNRLVSVRAVGEGGRFEVDRPATGVGAFGGYLMAVAVQAAHATVEGMRLHALHATFLARPEPGAVAVEVERTRTTRSSATRRVVVQPDTPAVVMTASFHAPADGEAPSPPRPSPGIDALGRFPSLFREPEVLDLRPLDPGRWERATTYSNVHPYWARPAAALGAGAAAAAVALAFTSDYRVVGTATPPGDEPVGPVVTLDHSLWVHRATHADEWLRYEVGPPTDAGARVLARGTVHDAAGHLVASFAQDMLRLTRP
jgi:acyl-CoA thioesterase-2